MDEPKVSVVIPSYNRFDSLLSAIESVQDQNYDNIEIIIINDGSDDKRYKTENFNSNVTVINLEENQKIKNGFGPGAIRNFGIKNSNGKYIAFLDDDDIWLPGKLKKQIQELENNEFKFSATDGLFGSGKYSTEEIYPLYNQDHYFKDIKYKYRKTKYLKNGKFPKIWDKDFIEVHNCIVTSSVGVEKHLLELLGGFRGLPMWADYDCWKGLLQLTSLIYVNEPFFYYDNNHGSGQEYFK